MKKNLIALAVTTLIATPAAFADVEVGPIAIYGTLQTAVEMITLAKNGAVVASTEDSQTRLADQTSKLGFKTKLDLGNGSFALGQIESRFYIGNNGNNSDDKAELGGRNTFVGVGSSDVGTLRLGRYDNAYKLSSKQMGPLRDNLNDASDDTGDKQILNRLGARQGDLIAYESPNWGCFTALFSYNFGKDSTGSISGGSAANTAKFTPATDLMNQMSIGLGYGTGAFNVEARYAMADDVSGNLSTGALAKETGSTQYGLAMAYQLHKNVQIVGSITSVDNKKNASYTSASGFKLAKGVDMQQIAVGIAATF
jgi:predicted porin